MAVSVEVSPNSAHASKGKLGGNRSVSRKASDSKADVRARPDSNMHELANES